VSDQGTFLAYRNWVEEVLNASITSSVESFSGRGPQNVKTRESDDFWRFPVADGASSAILSIDFGADRSVGLITTQFPRGVYPGVSESNPVFASTDTIRVRLLDASNTQLFDSGTDAADIVVGYMSWYLKLDTATTARKVEITYTPTSRIASGFCDVGSVGAWSIIEPAVGFSYPAGFGWIPSAETAQTPGGRVYTARFEPRRRWQLAFEMLTNSESLLVDEMLRYSGGARQVFVRRGDLPVGRDAMHALVSASRDIESVIASHRSAPLTFEEFI
jgi:hypothetical protein